MVHLLKLVSHPLCIYLYFSIYTVRIFHDTKCGGVLWGTVISVLFKIEKKTSAYFMWTPIGISFRKFTACKRTQTWRESSHFRQNSRPFLVPSSTFRCWGSLASFQAWGTPGSGSWNVLITGSPGWGFEFPLATALCKNLPAKNTQR